MNYILKSLVNLINKRYKVITTYSYDHYHIMFKEYYTLEEEIKLTDINGNGFDYDFTCEYNKHIEQMHHLIEFLINSILNKYNINQQIVYNINGDGSIAVKFTNDKDYEIFKSELQKLNLI